VVASDTIYYFKLDTAYQQIDSDDYDGKAYPFAADESRLAWAPAFDDGDFGFGFTFGGVNGHWGGEIYVRATKLDGYYYASNGTFKDDINYSEIGGNIKYYFFDFDKTIFNVYAMAGLAYTKIKSKNGGQIIEESGNPLEQGSAYFDGKTYNFGLGGTCRFGDHIGLEAQYIYGINRLLTAHAFGTDGVSNDFDSDIQTLNFGMNYYF
jgi:hypothetical protein